MQFKDIIGQNELKKRLINSVLKQRISHAQLFAGTEGVGKMALALAYTQYICCQNRTNEDSCGVCPACKKISKLIHPDLHFVFPVIRTSKFQKPVSNNFLNEWREMILQNPYIKKTGWLKFLGDENAKGSIYVQESQEIIKKLNLKTYESEYKTMIIWLPETMNMETSNKLLKMIEEPPAKTLFILISEEPQKIIQTILSRTQMIKINRIDDQSLLNKLKTLPDINDKDAQSIVRIANGNYLEALNQINKNEENKEYFEVFTEIMRLAYSVKVLDIMKWADKVAKFGREKQRNFLKYSMRMIRENFAYNVGNDKKEEITYLSNEEYQFSQKFSPFISPINIIQITEELQKADYHIQRNGSAKIILLDMALKMTRYIKAGVKAGK